MYTILFQTIILHKKCTKVIYSVLNENKVTTIAVTKWKTYTTDYNVEDLTVDDILKISFKTIIDSSVQWLLFRIVQKIISAGYYLKY